MAKHYVFVTNDSENYSSLATCEYLISDINL